VLLIIFYKIFIAYYVLTHGFNFFAQFLIFFKLCCFNIKMLIFFIKGHCLVNLCATTVIKITALLSSLFCLIAVLIIIRGGSPRYRIDQLGRFNFGQLFPIILCIFLILLVLFLFL
jgi:NADH:ubiquinone oxidoreductase subunit H